MLPVVAWLLLHLRKTVAIVALGYTTAARTGRSIGACNNCQQVMNMRLLHTAVLSALLALAGATGAVAQTTSTTPPPAEPTEVEISNIGNEEILRLLVLAQLKKQGIANPTEADIAAATAILTAQRTSGMGWGAMANAMGLRLGEVISSAKRSTPEKPQSAAAPNKPTATASNGNGNGNGNSNSSGSRGSSGSRSK